MPEDDIAGQHAAAGRFADAAARHEQILADLAGLGPRHREVLAQRVTLASAYEDLLRPDEAIALLEGVLADQEQSPSPGHPSSPGPSGPRGASGPGRLETRAFLGRVYEQVLGRLHRDTMNSRAHLAGALLAAGRTSAGFALLERNLADHAEAFGDRDRATLTCRFAVACHYDIAERFDEAIAHFAAVVAGYEHLLGPDHPDTRSYRNGFAFLLHRAGHQVPAPD